VGASIAVAHFWESTVPATKIMLIRHAERPNKKDKGVNAQGKRDREELIVRGWQRSGALVRLFAPRHKKFVDPRLAQPKTIFASAVTKRSTSWRPQHTVLAWAKELKLELDVRFPKGDELDLAEAAIAAKGPVLIAWEHEAIPDIVNAIVGNKKTCPKKWPGSRYDLVWMLDRRAPGAKWGFRQVPQMLLHGDSEEPAPFRSKK
jgi:hypothetical protein